MRKIALVIALISLSLGVWWLYRAPLEVGGSPSAAVLISSGDIAATVAAAPQERVSDQQIRMVDAGSHNVGIGVVRRPAANRGGAILHNQQTEVYRVLEGAGTLVTGGTLIEPRALDPESGTVLRLTGPSSVGSGIEGGETLRIEAGDMVIIPAGVAHGFSNVEEDITYLVIRIDPEQLVELK